MSVNYLSTAVIGCIIDEEKIPKKKYLKKTCSHDFPENVIYHPQTGRVLWEELSYPEFAFDSDRVDTDKTRIIDIGELKCVLGTDGFPVIIGYATESLWGSNIDDSHRFSELPDIEWLRDKLKSILEPLHLWNESEFGLYNVMYCSY